MTDHPHRAAEAVDPDEIPFATPPIEGLPFGKRSDEAKAIRRVTEDHPEDPGGSPFATPPIEGLPFAKDSEEAEAIRRVIEQAERGRPGDSAARGD
jgi:predicted Ser/Thr protein kinase